MRESNRLSHTVACANYARAVAAVEALLETFDLTTSLEEAERALDSIAEADYPPDLPLGDMYDGLAEAAAEVGDYSCAVRAQRRALELGYEWEELGREMLGWYLLKDSQAEEGEAVFRELRQERPTDAFLVQTLAAARHDAGLETAALAAHDEALAIAKVWDPEMLDQARVERRHLRQELGLNLDDDDRLALEPRRYRSEDVLVAVAWFPRDEHGRALAKWPDLGDDLEDPDGYCKRIEGELRRTRELIGRNPKVAPLRVDKLETFAKERYLDPNSRVARSRYAAALLSAGETLAWPPGRNDHCWCGSQRKYKRCCGRD